MSKANGHYDEFRAPSLGRGSSGLDFPSPLSTPAGNASASVQIIEADSALLADGRIIDLVTTSDGREPRFVVWKNGEYELAGQVECAGKIYVPPQFPPGLAAAVQLPRGIGPLLTARELVLEIEIRSRHYVDISEDHAFLMALFAIASFFPDRLPVAPYVMMCGPLGSGKSTLMRFLRCVTRRGLYAGDITRASLYRLTHLLSPTILIDENDFGSDKTSRDLMRLLRNGDKPNADVYVNGERFRVYGPKVLCSRAAITDAALCSRGIHFSMLPSDVDLLPITPEEEEKISDELQPKLERFRLEHYLDMRAAGGLDLGGMTPRVRDLAKVLAAPIVNEPDLLQRLASCLQIQDQNARLDRQGDPEWAVTMALFAVCHRHGGSQIFIGNLAEEVARILCDLGETPLSPKQVGIIARRSLGAETKRIGRGYYLQLTPDRRRQIHQLARAMGVTKADILPPTAVASGCGGPPCLLCEEFGLNRTPEGIELRSVELPPSSRPRKRLFDPDALD